MHDWGKHGNVIKEGSIKRKKMNKLKESEWKFTYSLSAQIFALYVTYNEPWFTNTRYFWAGPGDQVWPDLKIKLKLKGWNIFALIYWETRRSDFVSQMIHHLTALSLLLLSCIFGMARGTSVVAVIYEGSDVLNGISKDVNIQWIS
ncbi:Ceramide synthase 1 [Datura stramonium]|uniref:Ceramide synthase 1 n=1 Tax=Datura stramonium TaxID=4076 RepID=A0ABS8S9D2_DATST|nr:Ceramide synthase 1 [Datura stramonium]